MKNISTGFGLCAIAAAVALYPVLDRFAPIAKEAHAGVPVSAITSAALAQTAPTIVWYGTSGIRDFENTVGQWEPQNRSSIHSSTERGAMVVSRLERSVLAIPADPGSR